MNKIPKAVLPIILTLVVLLTGCQSSPQPSPGASPTSPVTAPAASVTNPTPPEGTRVGNLAPDFQLQNLDEQTTSLSDLRGKPVLLNFWATWCPPCRDEMPYLQQIYEEWSGKGLVLLATNIGESSSRVEEFMQSHSFSLPVLLHVKQVVAQGYNITGIPTTFFIDKNGIIQEKKVGSFWSKEEIEGYLGKIIP